jgi:DNA-binding transcriptional MocR family regulator
MPPLRFRTAIRLGLFFNCTTGQCNPGYPKLARAVGAKLGSVKKECRELEADGWIKRRRSVGGDHENTTEFDLFIPPARVSRVDTRGDRERVSKNAATGVQNRGGTGVHRGLANEH